MAGVLRRSLLTRTARHVLRRNKRSTASSSAQSTAAERAPLAALQVGEERRGLVLSVRNAGAFVDVNATSDGLLPRRLFSATVAGHGNSRLEDFVQPQTTQAFVVSEVNPESNTLILNLPQDAQKLNKVTQHPPSTYQPGAYFEGFVVDAKGAGVFIDVGAPVDALLPRSRLSPSHKVFARGASVAVRVTESDFEKNTLIVEPADDAS